MLELNNITLLCINGTLSELENDNCIKSLLYSSKNIRFCKTKFLTAVIPDKLIYGIEYVRISKMTYPEYNNFIIKELYNFVDTDFVLVIQDDGFVIHPELWSDDFLKYDYIGAPWPDLSQFFNGFRVGNGGFSLRSRKLLKVAQKHCPATGINEDVSICVHNRKVFTIEDIKFAPMSVAKFFSIEQQIKEFPLLSHADTFGFHGKAHTDLLNLLNEIEL